MHLLITIKIIVHPNNCCELADQIKTVTPNSETFSSFKFIVFATINYIIILTRFKHIDYNLMDSISFKNYINVGKKTVQQNICPKKPKIANFFFK